MFVITIRTSPVCNMYQRKLDYCCCDGNFSLPLITHFPTYPKMGKSNFLIFSCSTTVKKRSPFQYHSTIIFLRLMASLTPIVHIKTTYYFIVIVLYSIVFHLKSYFGTFFGKRQFYHLQRPCIFNRSKV